MTSEEFDGFYLRHREPSLAYARSLGCRQEDAEDLVHDVLLEICEHGQHCALQIMIRQRVIKLNRHKGREVPLPASHCQRGDAVQEVVVADCLGSLGSPVDQSVLGMRYEGLNDAQVARRLGITRAAVEETPEKVFRMASMTLNRLAVLDAEHGDSPWMEGPVACEPGRAGPAGDWWLLGVTVRAAGRLGTAQAT